MFSYLRRPKTALFFVANCSEYLDAAMDLRPLRYFEKPFDVARLYFGLDKAMEYIGETYVDIFLQSAKTQRRFLVDDILYIAQHNRKVTLTTSEGQFIISESFNSICQKLPASFFYPVHKSFYVNLHHINRYSYSELFLTDGTTIPIASRKQAAFRRFWFEYIRRH